MAKYVSPLKIKDIVTLIGLIIVGFVWTLIDQIFLPQAYERFIAFIILIFILYYLQFAINKPTQVMQYANTIAITAVSFTIIISVIMHVIMSNDFSGKSIAIWLIAGLLPYITGFVYLKTRKRK